MQQHSQPHAFPFTLHFSTYSALRLTIVGYVYSPGEVKGARADLQSVHDKWLRRICLVKHAPSAVLLGGLALSPLQVFWWQQIVGCKKQIWNMIAAGPTDFLSTSLA